MHHNSRVDINYPTVTVTLFRFFYFVKSEHQGPTKVLHTKFQLNKPCCFEENFNFIGFVIFCISRHLGFSAMLNFKTL